MRLAAGQFNTVRYTLEPGDGTRYQFSITSCIPQHLYFESEEPDYMPERYSVSGVISGIGRTGEEYVTVTIHCPSQGTYEFAREQLRNIDKCFVYYASDHMFNVDPYTVTAVLLASSILIDRPWDLKKAADKMLKVKDLLHGE